MSNTSVDPLLRHLASWGLVGGPELPFHVDRNADIQAIARRVRLHRVTGVAIEAIKDDALDSDGKNAALADAIAEHHRDLLLQSMGAEADLVRLVRRLDHAGIECRVLKGLATAHLDHGDPALRITSDVDLLVAPGQLADAQQVLVDEIDLPRSEPDRRVAFVERYGKDRTLRLHTGGWLDLHQMVAPAYWGLSIDHQRLFERSDSFVIAGTTLRALDLSHRFVHAVLHAGATDQLKLQSLRDVFVLGQHLTETGVEPAEVLAQPWLANVHGLLAAGLEQVRRHFCAGAAITDLALALRPTRRERWALRTRGLDGSRDHWSGPLALPSREWPRYLLPIVVPSAEYRAWFGRSRLDHIRTARRAFRR